MYNLSYSDMFINNYICTCCWSKLNDNAGHGAELLAAFPYHIRQAVAYTIA